MSDQATLKERLLEYITGTDFVSFAELGNRFGKEFQDGEMSISKGENVVLWAGMTECGAQAVSELLDEGAIQIEPCRTLVYLIDGSCLTLPVMKRPRRYKKPHWLPVTLRPVQASRGRKP